MGSSGGGGGGSYYSGSTSDSNKTTQENANSTSINDYLNGYLRDIINQKDTEKINQRKDEVKRILENEFGEAIDIASGGSYSKQTYVNGLSDVDLLYDLGDYTSSNIEGKEDPKNVIDQFAQRIHQRYPTSNIKQGKMAVTIEFSDGIELQVLPAFRYYNGYKVPDPDNNSWVCSFPKNFSSKLTAVNQANSGVVKPVIKLTKEILANNGIKVKGYHLENMAVDTFQSYDGAKTPKAMTSHLISHMKNGVLKRVGDPCGQSEYVDDYLGSNGSLQRRELSSKISNLENKINNATTEQDWKKIMTGN